jgi:hypothetical protein
VGRTVLSALGIAMGVATIVALLALSSGFERSAAGLINLGGAELGLFQSGVGELTASSLPESLVPRVRRQAGVADATPIAVATGELRGKPSFLVFGVAPGSFVWRILVRRPAQLGIGGRYGRAMGTTTAARRDGRLGPYTDEQHTGGERCP